MTSSLPDGLAWSIFERMLLIRRFEEAVLCLSNEKQFVGHYHLYIGQEATGAAIMPLLDARDRIATTHRNHGHVLARGADPGRALAEILGRATGLNGGRGGTLHLSAPDLGFISTSGIVGGCISLGVGGGYACRQRGDGAVSAVFFGDGALEEGVSFEALNIASLWRLPVLFVCENNLLDMRYARTYGRARSKASPSSRSSMTRPSKGRRSNVGSGRAQPSFPLCGKRLTQGRRAYTTELNGRRGTFLRARGGVHVAR
jgi:TPP-dependent pyruvate/acetoin dehydrogenase alpha subunit